MRKLSPLLIIVCAVAIASFTLLGDDSYSRLSSLRDRLVAQKQSNRELRENVFRLRREVSAIRRDDRVLERAARDELGMARPDEVIFIFDEFDSETQSRK